ncbi:hypothetical protein PV371_38320 [Streptomyces sp. TX20-6-3]|uniref:hypothetical protein n=1 Tax=Streptomyces sp. TX20-6-3 TaxID=3028705 RepID=UPI0029B264F5|nr:hypothetical protein [Streptomyces sp. TX20-6-3]MDX2565400.1 hypothetical protein [Streptomyces sp. TX20-6-3]
MRLQQPFRLDDLGHVRLAARRAANPFFHRMTADPSYTRTVFAGRGLLFLAHPNTSPSPPSWRVYLAFFAPLEHGAWLVLLPHHHTHQDSAQARQSAEDLAAGMHRTSWHHAVGFFAHTTPTRHTPPGQDARSAYRAAG